MPFLEILCPDVIAGRTSWYGSGRFGIECFGRWAVQPSMLMETVMTGREKMVPDYIPYESDTSAVTGGAIDGDKRNYNGYWRADAVHAASLPKP